YSGQPDVVFGVTMSGRPPELAGVEEMVGMLITTLPVRAKVRGEQSLSELLGSLQAQMVESQRCGYTPLTEAQALSGVTPGEPLFHSLVVFENYPMDEDGGEGGFSVVDASGVEHTNYPLVLVAAPGPSL